MRIDELIDGFVDTEDEAVIGPEGDEEMAEDEVTADNGADEEEDEEAVAAATAAKLEQLKADSLERFAVISGLFSKIGKAYEKYGYRSKQYDKLQGAISDELMKFRPQSK